MPQIPPTPSISGNTISSTLQSAINYRPTVAAVAKAELPQGIQVSPLQTPQLYSRLTALQSNLVASHQMSAAAASMNSALIDVDSALLSLTQLLPAIAREPSNTHSRQAMERQVMRIFARMAASLGLQQDTAGKGASGNVLAALNAIQNQISDFDMDHTGNSTAIRQALSALQSEVGEAAEVLTRLRSLIERLGNDLPSGLKGGADRIQQLSNVIRQIFQGNSTLIAKSPEIHARVAVLLSEATSLPGAAASPANAEALSLASAGTLGRDLSMTRLLSAYAATSQYFDLVRMKSKLGNAREKRATQKDRSKNDKKSTAENLFDNFFTFFAPQD